MSQHKAEPVPELDRGTVEFALRAAPERCPDPRDSDREIWMKAGERRLALLLQSILMKQEKNYIVS